MSWESPYFTSEEMSCSHTGLEKMDARFMEMLTELRVAYAKPLRVTSAYRDISHPIEARKIDRGATKGGAHTTGKAADIGVERGEAYEVLKTRTRNRIHRYRCSAERIGAFSAFRYL
jgi:zinc D-Ala-D-Ala carboxypeptidase